MCPHCKASRGAGEPEGEQAREREEDGAVVREPSPSLQSQLSSSSSSLTFAAGLSVSHWAPPLSHPPVLMS